MEILNAVNNLPAILDFEASSLSDGSYPISVGLVVDGKIKYWVVKPKSDWVDWSLTSQAIHGIPRSFLMEKGTDALIVYAELKAALFGCEVIYSDNPYWEARWLRCLGQFDCEIRDVRDLVPATSSAVWSTNLDHQFASHDLTRHRADHDAYALYLSVSQLRANAHGRN